MSFPPPRSGGGGPLAVEGAGLLRSGNTCPYRRALRATSPAGGGGKR
jgi:hypothetical protein